MFTLLTTVILYIKVEEHLSDSFCVLLPLLFLC